LKSCGSLFLIQKSNSNGLNEVQNRTDSIEVNLILIIRKNYEGLLMHSSSYSVNTTIPLVLQKLASAVLHSKLVELTSRERKLTTHILWHLAEVDRRKLYLQMAYPSFFEYLVAGLGYAPASAQRRIDAARLLAQLPQNKSQQVAQKIEAGDLNLSQISKLQSFSRQARKETGQTVSPEQKSQILQQIENQSVVQTEKILAKALDIKPQQQT
jgi:hypothetical protein